MPSKHAECLTQEDADRLVMLVTARQRHLMMATILVPDQTPEARLSWARTYLEAVWVMRDLEMELAIKLTMFPWTIHVAGAPGFDERLSCGESECDNPYCGHVQKCSRCHDILSFGYSGPGRISEMLAQSLGGSIQEYMHHHFGENPMDESGPTWFPVGTRIAKRSDGPQAVMFLPDMPGDGPELGANEYFKDCEEAHSAVLRQMRQEGASPG